MSEPEKRGPGRPKKKGTVTWKPAQRLETYEKTPGFRYRWCWKDDANLDKKKAEGWIFVNKTTGIEAEHEQESADIGTAKTHRELVLMALPEELGKARDEYIESETEKKTRGLKKGLQAELAKGGAAKVEGKIIIQ